jgi:DNA mismatch repair ATPase MutL
MKRRIIERVVLSFVCALALILIPLSNSWAQSEYQQQPTEQQQNQDIQKKDSDANREKASEGDQNSMQNQNRSTESQTKTESQRTETQKEESTTDRDAEGSREGLPATAGELPLLGLIGLLSLATAAGTRAFARAKR